MKTINNSRINDNIERSQFGLLATRHFGPVELSILPQHLKSGEIVGESLMGEPRNPETVTADKLKEIVESLRGNNP